MEFTLTQAYVLLIVVFLIISLYREIINPSLTFFIATVALLLGNVITPPDILKGLSNDQIIIIFLLVLVTAGIRSAFGTGLFDRLFNTALKPKVFLFRMMLTVSSVSAFLNNTPIVAFMIPYVKDWAKKTGNPASKFLIPLSFATILGGMITVIGTSTNLVLNALIKQSSLQPLEFQDFLYLGICVTLVGWIYLYFVGYKLLPSNPNEIDALMENLREYIVETEIAPGSTLIGKSVKDAALRNLQDVFLVEIIRDERIISPVSPDEVLESRDILFFSGNVQSIYKLIREDNGLSLPKADLNLEEHFQFVDAVIPANSALIGQRIKDSNFRERFNASIIAIHRDGRRVAGKVGETYLAGGDFLLLLAGDHPKQVTTDSDLFFLSAPKRIKSGKKPWLPWLGIGSLILLGLGVVNIVPLFNACVIILATFVVLGTMTLTEIRKELDLSLLLILICSLALGVGLQKSGTADWIARGMLFSVKGLGPIAVLTTLFLVTIFLTALITNAAAVAIVFPIAMSLADQSNLPYTPFFVAIAFAASGDFMTPIGYQCNLMVYGPGGYKFRDFIRVGTPLTVLYVLICVTFISVFYSLV